MNFDPVIVSQNSPAFKLLTDNLPRYWWQSRHNLPDPPQLACLPSLAREIRRGPWR